MSGLREEAVQQYCKVLHLPTVGSQFVRMAEEAVKQQHGPIRYLEALLAAELRRTRAACGYAADLRGETAPPEDAGRVRFCPGAADFGRHGYNSWPKADTSSAPNRFCSLVNRVAERPIWRPDCAWRLAASDGVFGSRLRPRWSTSWWKLSMQTS